MIKITTKLILAAALLLTSADAFSQKTFRELGEITRLNRGVSGLRSMQDGEHYTVNRAGAILRYAYADAEQCDTLYKGSFASYAFSPAEDMIILGNNYRPVYRHSSYVDYKIVRLSDKSEVAALNNIRDLSFSPDSKMVAFAKQNNLYSLLYSRAYD